MLSDVDRAVLAMEARFWKHQGSKEEAIWLELGLSPVRYYQRVRTVALDPAALAADPVTVSRLRRRMGARRARP